MGPQNKCLGNTGLHILYLPNLPPISRVWSWEKSKYWWERTFSSALVKPFGQTSVSVVEEEGWWPKRPHFSTAGAAASSFSLHLAFPNIQLTTEACVTTHWLTLRWSTEPQSQRSYRDKRAKADSQQQHRQYTDQSLATTSSFLTVMVNCSYSFLLPSQHQRFRKCVSSLKQHRAKVSGMFSYCYKWCARDSEHPCSSG